MKSGHADIIGISYSTCSLPPSACTDRALQCLGKLHQRRMRTGTAAAAEQP